MHFNHERAKKVGDRWLPLLLCLVAAPLMLFSLTLKASGISCGKALLDQRLLTQQRLRAEVELFKYDMANLQIASLSDPTLATGATVFYFPQGARASYDSRGGSVAAIETTLLDEGSYTNNIDAIVFAGGSTMGLAAHGGVRKVLFNQRKNKNGDFEAIPSVPGAIIYDFEARSGTQDRLVYPTEKMGAALMKNLKSDEFIMGRAGAGTSSTANKLSAKIFGGQGAAQVDLGYAKIFVAVVPNPVGDIQLPGQILIPNGKRPIAGRNTTLSLVVVDVELDRSQLRRLAVAVHTSMARHIQPFHTYTDGDILFTVSNGDRKLPSKTDSFDPEHDITESASRAMGQAILRSAQVANGWSAQ